MHLRCNATKLSKSVPEMMVIRCARFPSCKSLSHASLSKKDIFMRGGSLGWVFCMAGLPHIPAITMQFHWALGHMADPS